MVASPSASTVWITEPVNVADPSASVTDALIEPESTPPITVMVPPALASAPRTSSEPLAVNNQLSASA